MKPYPLLPGERAIPGAPDVDVNAPQRCIPQHYLSYQHTLDTVEALLSDVDCDPHYPVFVGHSDDGIYLQVGIIGYDNYKPLSEQSGMKITYGRKWRIEPNLPSSEILQTAFLAIMKAREHEIRERLVVFGKDSKTTPFNTHHDLPLMARLKTQLLIKPGNGSEGARQQVDQLLESLRYDHARFELIDLTPHRSSWLIDLKIIPGQDSSLPEIHNHEITLVARELNRNTVLYALMEHLIYLSNRWIEETFSYRGLKRFSQQLDVMQISNLSRLTRAEHLQRRSDAFVADLHNTNQQVDRARVPRITKSTHRQRLMEVISCHDIVDGFLP